jgi:predicted nucleic acid-binding protein
MDILCDTSSIMMLIRIAPDMFLDRRYQCVTLNLMRHEIFRNPKFKRKYPWRNDFKTKIQGLPSNFTNNADVNQYFEAINLLIRNITINAKTGRPFDLSYVDQMFLACALANGYKISTGDKSLALFALQEFRDEFHGNISPLGIINGWMREGLIKWNEELHSYVAGWKITNEHPQPPKQIREFKKLTGLSYPGS